MFGRLREWARALRARRARNDADPTIVATDAGFTLRRADGETVEVAWTQVRAITALKLDLYTADAINLLLELDPPAPSLLSLAEYWPGFAELFGPMERALGVSPTWYVEIMTPAFEATPRVLYTRPPAALSSEDTLRPQVP